MELIYPINFIGHDEWLESGYSHDLAGGDVVTRDGEIVGRWLVINYDPKASYEDDDGHGGSYGFIPAGEDAPTLTEEFAILDSRVSRGWALSTISRAIRDWYDAENPDFPISMAPRG